MADSNVQDRCRKCQKPRGGSASITQWIVFCQCESLKPPDEFVDKKFCATCGKSMGDTRRGSLTQWIFSDNLCRCKFPVQQQEQASAPNTVATPSFKMEEPSSSDELKVDAREFPVERYAPLRLLGTGGIGEVYLCYDRMLNKHVAVKCLRRITDDFVVSFQSEAKIASKLNHPAIIEILDFGTTESGKPYMVMEYFKGTSLQEMIEEAGFMPEEATIGIFTVLCDALSYMHNQGVFHRDLKPSNVLISVDENGNTCMRIIDFGLSNTTGGVQEHTLIQGRTVVGTPSYMSPDQISGLKYNAASEVYSVGCMMYESLTGTNPFRGETALEVLNEHLRGDIPSPEELIPELSPRICSVVNQCLELDNSERFQSMSDLTDALSSCRSVSSNDETLRQPTKGKVGMPLIFASCVAVLAIFIVGVFVVFVQTQITVEPKKEKKASSKTVSTMTLANELVKSQERALEGGSEFALDALDAQHLIPNSDQILVMSEPDIGARLRSEVSKHRVLNEVIAHHSIMNDEYAELIVKLNPRIINLSGCTGMTDSTVKILSKSRRVILLDLSDAAITPNGIRMLAKFPELKALALSRCQLNDSHILAMSQLKSIDTFHLTKNPKLTTKNLKCLSRKPEIVKLTVDEGPLAFLPDSKKNEIVKSLAIVIFDRPEDESEGDAAKSLGRMVTGGEP